MISMHKIPITARPLHFLADAVRKLNYADTLVVVPTQRNRRALVALGGWDADIQTVAEFNSRAMLHRSKLLPTELRSYYLYKAATALSEVEQTCLMNRNASNFLKNYISFVRRSAALLPFFRELCAEQVDVSQLMKAGLYQDYEEQLTVLLRLWELYLTAIHSAGYVDEWESFLAPASTNSTGSTIDISYVQRYKRYIFLVGGYLNNFELAQLGQLSAICDVSIFFNYVGGDSPQAKISAHPQQEKFAERFGITDIETFEGDKALAWASVQSGITDSDALTLRLDYTNRPVHTLANQPPQLQIVPCESAMAQYDMITRQICSAHWLEGIDFSDMAVVLPAERMASWFLYSDPAQLYRVSAGRDIASFPFFELFQNVIALLRGFRSNLIKLGDIERLFAHPLFKELDNIDIHMAVDELRSLTKSGRLLYTLDDLRYSDIKGMQSIYKLIVPFIGGNISYGEMLERVKRFFLRFWNTAPTGRGQDPRETSEATESRRRVPQDSSAVEDRERSEPAGLNNGQSLACQACAELGTGRADEALKLVIDELDKMLLLYRGIEEELPAGELVQRIAMELSQLKVTADNSQQGRVRVIGLLESRNMAYKLLFIPDMNHDSFPADQNKDLFLNSELRRELHLPTFADRQELQKGYMSQVIARAKSVYLSYTKSEETQPSVYLNEILTAAGHRFDDQIDEKKRSNILYKPANYLMLPVGAEAAHPINMGNIIKDAYMVKRLQAFRYSASSINTIKSCEYQFYYRYVESLRPAAEAVHEAGSLEIGTVLHNVLERLFKQGARPQDEDYLLRMSELFEQETSRYHYFRYNKVGVYEVKAMQSNFAKIVQAERARINAGAVPKSFESEEKMSFYGVNLIGRVDRVDETSSGYAIIDYKYRNYYDLRQTDDFQKLDVQLPLYALIMKAKRGSYPSEMLWFSLKKNPAFIPAYDPEKLDQFETELQAFFEKWFTEDVPLAGAEADRVCKNCDYAGFCHKSLL